MATLREWLAGRRVMLAKFVAAVEGIITILAIATGGGACGYFFAQYQMRTFMLEERADHVAEIERLQRTYADTLGYLTSKAGATADAAEAAATQSAQAAVEAKDSARAAKRVTVPAAPSATTPISETQRNEVNRKIEAVNRKVREKP